MMKRIAEPSFDADDNESSRIADLEERIAELEYQLARKDQRHERLRFQIRAR
jgi:hypothetical protein